MINKLLFACALLLLCSCETEPTPTPEPENPEVPEVVPPGVDLSADGTANCYLVTTPGDYRFRATVRGNGVGDETSAGFEPQIALTEAMTIDWLWTDSEGLVSAITLDKTAGTISFTVGEGAGNTLLALIDDGEVVWSWHIWATEAPQVMTCENGVQFLDRNLGATDTTPGSAEAYGMYYQWGRKDPFYGGDKTETSATTFAEAKANTIVNPAYEALVWNFNKTTTTAADAAAHPMTFFHNAVGTGYNWLATPKATLWGAAKTLNDPCPVGYKVPAAAAWDNFSSGNKYIAGVSAWDSANRGMTYTYNGQTAWYPAQGYRNYSTGSIVGIGGSTGGSGSYWASDVASAKSCFYWFRSPISSSSGEINNTLDKERSYGYAVRCCKE